MKTVFGQKLRLKLKDFQTGLTQLSQAMVRLRRAERQTT
ncbi:hypothetical protein GXM_00505 [Nostoc sphaeroides CCNUC1]|uniref:Uncharacterized protein n=1 Tax=Nostoc sphaeroides CCNUC1 TaxID=2653204 RepID=A0A5P8VRH6_9NOSO|nr:hypothetical protein GXM_00505 [Nostoc sphaeroides CCNUC1]